LLCFLISEIAFSMGPDSEHLCGEPVNPVTSLFCNAAPTALSDAPADAPGDDELHPAPANPIIAASSTRLLFQLLMVISWDSPGSTLEAGT
jgi:hypothetical protein